MMMSKRKTTVWILGDQLLNHHPAVQLAQDDGDDFRIVLVENWNRARRLSYHRKKIVLIFSAMRHYAELLRERGYTLDYLQTDSLRDALLNHTREHQPDRILTMAASEYRGRQFQQTTLGRVLHVPVDMLPNTQFLIGQYNPNPDPDPDKQYIMETFYRAMRRHFDILIEPDGKPTGGAWNFDKENRKPLPKRGLELPTIEGFSPDSTTQSVMEAVETEAHGLGTAEGFAYAVTHEEAEAALHEFISTRLDRFGPYEDAMSAEHRTLFHSVLSTYLNIGLLEPMQMIRAAESAYHKGDVPINSAEGFIRQVLGWREYMAWQYWNQMPALAESNDWDAQRTLPDFFWDGQTDMRCLQHIVTGLLQTGYAHHIERLMVLSNFFMLTGIEPQTAVEWFSAMFIDAYDWVMQPNVIGMGLNADGGKIATKPYIASANYIHKMSNYCGDCRYNHRERHGEDACPFNYLYWNFLINHEERLRANPRSGPAVLGLRHLDDQERRAVQQQANVFLSKLQTS